MINVNYICFMENVNTFPTNYKEKVIYVVNNVMFRIFQILYA